MQHLPHAAILNLLLMFGVSLIACALLAFLETTVTAIRLFNVKQLAERIGSYTNLLKNLEQNQHRVLTTVIISNHIASVTAAVIGNQLMEAIFKDLPGSVGLSLGIFLTTLFILVFGEIIPKNIAKVRGSAWLPSVLWLINIIYRLLNPFVSIIIRLADTIASRLSPESSQHGADLVVSETELRFLIDYVSEKGIIKPEKTSMLKSVFTLSTTSVKDIMVPATDMVTLQADASLEDALTTLSMHHFSRVPVFDGKTDNIIGMLHYKDLFLAIASDRQPSLRELLRPILFVPESMKVNQLLKEFKQQRLHIAVVLNEYGGIVGIVTLEDVLEEIVGEIHDEYEVTYEKIASLRPGVWLVDATVDLEELSELLHIAFEAEDCNTLGGFLAQQLQHVPRKGERLVYQHYLFQVQQANIKRPTHILIFDQSNVPATPGNKPQ
jgi:CBS domain containing-hemolysin-like protein